MKSRIAIGVAVASLAVVVLSGCSPAKTSTTTSAPAPAKSTPAAPAVASGATLAAADSALGKIVVDGHGMAVYEYDKDTKGATSSSCTGQCATNWPAVSGTAASFSGVTGKVASITGVDGKPQLTLNGWPLYYFIGDKAAGDTKGQAVGGVWWVLTPAGEPINH